MKFLILTTLFGLSLATCGLYNNCKSCAGNLLCYWDVGDNKCKIRLLNPPTNDANRILLPLSCPAQFPPFVYTDDFGRNTAFVFSMASNAEGLANVDSCVQDKYPTAHSLQQFKIECDFLGSPCSGVLFDHPEENALVLAFRGSKGESQFLLEAGNFLTYASQPGPLYGGKVLTYYANAINKFWIEAQLESNLTYYASSRPNVQLWVFGHSLGGSLATLAANAAVRQGIFTSDKVRVVTLGEPRTGDYDFAADVSQNIPQTYRVIIKNDLVPKLPLKLLVDQTNTYHNNFEVWYDNNMTTSDSFVINNRADDKSGSNAVVSGTLDVHNSYYNIDMKTYGEGGCH